MSDSLPATKVETNQCPSHQSILLTQGPRTLMKTSQKSSKLILFSTDNKNCINALFYASDLLKQRYLLRNITNQRHLFTTTTETSQNQKCMDLYIRSFKSHFLGFKTTCKTCLFQQQVLWVLGLAQLISFPDVLLVAVNKHSWLRHLCL